MSDLSNKIKQTKSIKNYQIGELIGKGAVGEVFKALDTETAKTVAIKQIDLHNISQEYINAIETEINLLKKLDHPNIVNYIDFIQTKTHINIILEYVEGGSLQNLVKQNGPLGEYLVFVFVKQILEGLDYLHSQGIIHRDIKGANLLLTKNGVIKLADFGYSIKLSDKDKTNSIVGTCFWMAPEVIEQKGNISSACDVWSLGSTIIQLLTTKPPYYDYNVFAAMFRIVTDEHPTLPENISDNLRDFLKKCFIKDPHQRPNSKELLNHPWITTPNKKLVKKFINENNDTNVIPASLINEWKNNYKDNLSSMASSQNEKLVERAELDSGGIKEDEENHNVNDEEFERETFSLNKGLSKNDDSMKFGGNDRYSRGSSKINQNNIPGKFSSPRNQNSNFKGNSKHLPNNTIYEVASEHNTQPTHKNSTSSFKETYKNNEIKIKKSQEGILRASNSIENPGNLNTNVFPNTKSLSFQDDNFMNKSKSTYSDGFENINFYNNFDKNEEIYSLIENLKSLREESIKQCSEEPNIMKLCQDMFGCERENGKKSGQGGTNKQEAFNMAELKVVIEKLNQIDKINENDLFLALIKLATLFNSNTKTLLIDYFTKAYGIINFLTILNSPLIHSKSLYLMLYVINQINTDNSDNLEDFISYQLLFYVARLVHLFNDIEIKSEVVYMVFQILINSPGLLKLFLSSGGYFLIPTLLDVSLVKQSETLLILILSIFLTVLERSGTKFDEVALLFIKNKILTRLNIILLEIFSDEANLESEYIEITLSRIMDLLIKFTEIKKYDIICDDNIVKSLINLCYNIPNTFIPKFLQFFDNLLREPSTINKLENIGYLECLVKLLSGYSSFEADNEIDKNCFQKISKLILNQIKQMIKLNTARCEQLAILEGIPILTQLLHSNLYNLTLIPIFSDMICSTKFVRECLKKVNALELVLKFISNKAYKENFQEMIKNLLIWLEADKNYVETYLIDEKVFNKLFSDIHEVMSLNLIDYLSILLNFFQLSQSIEHKYFNTFSLFRNTWNTIMNNNFLKCNDILLMNKIVDFLSVIVDNKSKDKAFLNEIEFVKVLEKLKTLTKENNLIIIDEKVKTIMLKL